MLRFCLIGLIYCFSGDLYGAMDRRGSRLSQRTIQDNLCSYADLSALDLQDPNLIRTVFSVFTDANIESCYPLLKDLLEVHPEVFQVKNAKGQTLFHVAANQPFSSEIVDFFKLGRDKE